MAVLYPKRTAGKPTLHIGRAHDDDNDDDDGTRGKNTSNSDCAVLTRSEESGFWTSHKVAWEKALCFNHLSLQK